MPPKNFTATSVSPSTMRFGWNSPGVEDETYYLTCQPHHIKFPLSTSETVLKVGHFTPNTSYTCSLLCAHSTNITKAVTTVTFKTGIHSPAIN